MFACDEYPTIVPSDEKHLIYVEVFEVDEATLARLNRLEEPYNYRRETIYIPELGSEVEITPSPLPALQNMIKSDQAQVPASQRIVSLRLLLPKPERLSPQA